MLFGQDREQLRRLFFQAWQKKSHDQPLEPLESLIAEAVGQHPEYLPLLQPERLGDDYPVQDSVENPFLHLGLHIAVQEQLHTDRPPGVRAVYRQLCRRHGATHPAEHQMMEQLSATLQEATAGGRPPDESRYLQRLQQLLG